MLKTKIIGILGHIINTDEFSPPGYGQNYAYINFFRKYGEVIIIDPLSDNIIDFIDLLVLPGGRDANPIRYNEKPDINTQSPDLQYEYFYNFVFHKYLNLCKQNKLAIYGICAGFQNLNIYFGGKLEQHINQDYSTKNRGELVDSLVLTENCKKFNGDLNFPLYLFNDYPKKIKNNSNLMTNSIHHQGIYDSNYCSSYFKNSLSKEFKTLAYNEHYENVEVFIHNNLLIAGEQAHPEERNNITSLKLTNYLINLLLSKIQK